MIVFSVENLIDDKKDVKALFWAEDSTYKQISIETILYTIKSFFSEEQKKNIKFVKLYHGNGNFSGTLHNRDQNPVNNFYVLVKLVNNIPDSILRVSDSKYDLSDICDLLNEEVNSEIATYQIFKVPGQMK